MILSILSVRFRAIKSLLMMPESPVTSGGLRLRYQAFFDAFRQFSTLRAAIYLLILFRPPGITRTCTAAGNDGRRKRVP
jgi:hypothetical protein